MESLKRKHVVFDEENADSGPSEPAGLGVHPDRAAVVAAAEGAAVKKPKVRAQLESSATCELTI